MMAKECMDLIERSSRFLEWAGNKLASEKKLQAKADEFMARKQWLEAIGCLVALSRKKPRAELLQKLVDLRFKAFNAGVWPEPPYACQLDQDLMTGCDTSSPSVKEIERSALSARTLGSGIYEHGAVIVRDLISGQKVQRLRSLVNNAFEYHSGVQSCSREEGGAWVYRSPEVKGAPARFFSGAGNVKTASDSLWAVDSPYLAFELIEIYRQLGLPELLKELFGEPAVLTAKKWVLRKVAPNVTGSAGWHQDGRFLGEGIRTVNMWIALSDCGGGSNAPGMELIPSVERTLYPTGTHAADFDWTVGAGLIEKITRESSIENPRFQAGDALFFDHFNLHRTGFASHHTQPRYAIESWFFAASSAPKKQQPLFFAA